MHLTRLVTLTLLLLFALTLRRDRPKPPALLVIDSSIASDFNVVMRETWQMFIEVFDARRDCFGPVRVKATKEMTDRAKYDAKTATVWVQVPARIEVLRGALVHEWAHHIERQCPQHEQLREAFLEAQGISADTRWYAQAGSLNLDIESWSQIPSEQYAEAVVMLVLGRQLRAPSLRITDESIDVVRQWATEE